MARDAPLFIVGNSRSGTTMMGRMFGARSDVHTFRELHFFEQMVDATTITERPDWTEQQLTEMLERLLTSSRDGLFSNVVPGTYAQDANAIYAGASRRDPVSVYADFLTFETEQANRTIPCEQTPRYLYQAQEILDAFPNAHMVCMIRDPRSVLLSQKNRWRRGRFANTKVPLIWAARSWSNYHPYTTSLMWASASRRARSFASHPRFHIVQYETLLKAPAETISALCANLGLPYTAAMLNVAQIGSSSGHDRPDQFGVDVSRIDAWEFGGLSDGEIRLCERTTSAEMAAWDYRMSGKTSSPLTQAGFMIGFVVKSATALMLNFRRFKNLGETIRRRLT